MDGLTCARTIRDYEADGTICRHVPIIAVTANARLEQIETAIAVGMVSLHFILSWGGSGEGRLMSAGRCGFQTVPDAGTDTQDRGAGHEE